MCLRIPGISTMGIDMTINQSYEGPREGSTGFLGSPSTTSYGE